MTKMWPSDEEIQDAIDAGVLLIPDRAEPTDEELWAAWRQHELDAVMSGQPVGNPADWGLI